MTISGSSWTTPILTQPLTLTGGCRWFLDIAVFSVLIVTWFAILYTGRYPQGMFGFVEGVSAGTIASSPMRSPWSWIGTRPSGWPHDQHLREAELGCGRPAYGQAEATEARLTRSAARSAPVKDGEVHLIWGGQEATRSSMHP